MEKNVILVLLSLLCVGCQNKEDSFSPYYYYLKIRFEDQSGNDLVKGMMHLENEKDHNTYELSKSVYQLDVLQTGKSEEKLVLSLMYVHKTEHTNICFSAPARYHYPIIGLQV